MTTTKSIGGGYMCRQCGGWIYLNSAHVCPVYTTWTVSVDHSAEIADLKSAIEDLQDEVALLNLKIAKLKKRGKTD